MSLIFIVLILFTFSFAQPPNGPPNGPPVGPSGSSSSSGSSESSCSYKVSTISLAGTIRDVWACGNNSLPGAVFIHKSFNCGESMEAGQPTPPCVEGSPGWSCGVDFERAIGNDLGIAEIQINPNPRILVFNSSVYHPTVINQTQFKSWYVDDPNLNIPIPVNMTLSNADTCNSQVFSYSEALFFPIDGRGFGNYYILNGIKRNFGFTFTYNGRFTYSGDEYFNFAGDDDVWVFINNQLAIDIGGVHSTEKASIDLTFPEGGCPPNSAGKNLPCSTSEYVNSEACACSLGLVVGEGYNFDLFYNERHTIASDLTFTTSLNIQCPWYDWCHVCQGNGQSCCTCTSTDPCSTASCNITTGACINTPTVCGPPTNSCVTNVCQESGPSVGKCVEEPINCVGPDLCLDYSCNAEVGCTSTPKSCNDNDLCTVDTCDSENGNCVSTPVNCNDNNQCTQDSCQESSGQCLYVDITCNNGNECTNNTCNPTLGCTYANITETCITDTKCSIQGCNPETGCSSVSVNCNDGDYCTSDSCVDSIGCVYTNITCDDNNACTTDSCNVNSGCIYPSINCNDGNPCTKDYCNTSTGCYYVNISDCNACTVNRPSCPASTKCVTYECDPISETTAICANTSTNCDDGNLCTTDSCQSETGCVHTPVNCSSSNPCIPQQCNISTGSCQPNPVNCNDDNECTIDSCVSSSGVATCSYQTISCSSSNPCEPQQCNPSNGNCVVQPVNCNDNNLCTKDTCVVNGNNATCQFTPLPCTNPDKCHTASCNSSTGVCSIFPITCSDNNACTQDSCNSSIGCVFTPINCNDNDHCTIDSCSSTLGCQYAPVVCDDNDACTNGTCYPDSGCNYTLLPVPKGNMCLDIYCDSKFGIIQTPVQCPSACTLPCNATKGCQGCPGKSSTLGLAAEVGIGAGAIAGITVASIFGAVIFAWTGKKGYERLLRKKENMNTVQSNPMYQGSNKDVENPLYEANN